MTTLIIALLVFSLSLVGMMHLLRLARKLPGLVGGRLFRPAFGSGSTARRLVAASILILVMLVVGLSLFQFNLVQAQSGPLTVEIMAGYNLVVDSNVTSPSTFGPSAATVAGQVCNTGPTTLTNVVLNIGDYTGSGAGTPGIYPERSVDAGFLTQHPALNNPGSYAFTHEGGSLGLTDASRQIGALGPGQCSVQYWTFSYPRCENNPDGSSDTPQCQYDATWGDSVKPEDDLYLDFDVWATADSVSPADQTWRMYMRNEISAMANKIQPNGNPGGVWFNTDPATIRPGGVITTNGILYRIGNVRYGFDNDGDYLPDYNFWVQPIGDPGGFDPGCFRLIRTSGVITVAGSTPTVFTFTDQLYFTYPQVPDDNTNVTGEVFYTYVALGTNCAVTPSPYQEAASGYDNEKFNADYGSGGAVPMSVPEALVTIDKSGNPDLVNVGAVITYAIPFVNQSATESAGLIFYSGAPVNNPLVISDSIPTGTQYNAGSAGYTLGFSPNNGVKIFYSTDYGQSWSEVEPTPAASVTTIQWWLQDPLPPSQSGSASFAVTVPGSYSGGPVIENCANAQFGTGSSFAEACDNTVVQGNNSIGDEVWQDDNANGLRDSGEPVLGNINVSLYWDKNGDGQLDSNDVLVLTTTTGLTSTGNYTFTNLADGNYLVQVERLDPDRPAGYSLTTNEIFAVDLDSAHTNLNPVNYSDADFGFGPALSVTKSLLSSQALEGREIQYKISVSNLRPGDGSGQAASCSVDLWAGTSAINATGNPDWTQIANGGGSPDGSYALGNFAGNGSGLLGNNFSVSALPGNIVSVEAIYSLYVDTTGGVLNGDLVQGVVYTGTTATVITNTTFSDASLNLLAGSVNQGIFSWDITTARTNWSFSDFNNLLVEMYINKVGGADGAVINLDALGFRVTTDASCGSSADTLNPVPLSDTFDADLLQFVSASPPEISMTTGGSSPYANTGLITWDNIGPLYAGQTKEITVTFRGLEPNPSPQTLTNTAAVANAYFVTGDPANDDEDEAVTTITATGSISGVVWSDTDSDGWQGTVGYESLGATDFPIPEVTVVLYQCTGLPSSPNTGELCTSTSGNPKNNGTWTAVATTTTNVGGQYLFEGLLDGYYYVKLLPASLPGSTITQTAERNDANTAGVTCPTCDNQWGNPSANLGTFDNLSNAEHITNINFGYTVSPMIYGSVWQDYDADGVIDSNEPYLDNGTAGITVTLTDNLGNVLTTQTDVNGYYEFTGLTAGRSYTITVDTGSLPGGASPWTNTYDPDDGTASPNSQYPVGTLSAGQISGSHNFGYRGNADIGDTVYTDWNGDGNQDTGETGIQGLTVYLYRDENGDGEINNGDTLVMTDTTDASGHYLFENIPADDWIVAVDERPLITAYDQTGDRDGTFDGKTAFTTNGTTDVLDADFGYQPTGAGSIGDLVWKDMDANGTQSGSQETGIANITVTLYVDVDGDGVLNLSQDAVISTTVTGSSGNYLFTNLISATYFVDVATDDPDLPSDPYGNLYQLTTNNDPLTVTLSTGQSYLDADFGFAPPAAVGDLIYQDNNANGQYDLGEPGIPGVTVALYIDVNQNGVYDSGTDTFYANDVTDANGEYLFTGLPAGNYVVVVDDAALTGLGYSRTGDPEYPALSGTTYLEICSDDTTPDFGGCNAQSGFYLYLGQTDRTRDFGYRPPRSIGDLVWLDSNSNGVQDASEPGLGGITVTVTLPNSGGTFTTHTDNQGYYSFGSDVLGTDTGDFIITIDPGTVYTFTYDYDGGIASPDGQTIVPINSTGFFTDVIDFGLRLNGSYSITGTVFFDQGGETDTLTDTFTSGDTPYAGITVYLFDENGGAPIAYTTTDATGHYTFTNLFGGGITYTVSVNRNAPELANQTITANPDSVLNRHYHTLVITTANVSDIDFGFFSPRPDLSLIKSVTPAGTVSPGDTLTYTLTVSNTGSLTATGVIITDTIPLSTTFLNATTPYTGPTNGVITWSLGSVATQTNRVVTMAVQVDSGVSAGTVLTNTAWVTSSEGITATDTVTNDVVVPTADLAITKSDNPDPVIAGGILTYTLVYTNNGPAAAQDVYITDTLPLSVTFGDVISENPAISGPIQTGRFLTWFTPTLAAGASGSMVFTVTVDSAVTQTFTNSVSITSTTTDSNPNNNDDDEPTSIETADLSLDKSVDNTTPNVGQVITFTIVVNNAGPQNATNVEVVDVVPAGYNTITNISSGGIESGNVITWSGLGITAGQSITLSFRATVAATGPYTNLAQITAVDQYDIDSTPNNGVDTDGDGNKIDDSGDEDDGDGAVVTPTQLGSIGDYVWYDADGDGNQDVGESGLDGVVVQLEYSDGTTTTTTTTGGGAYDFTGLAAGTYTVTVISGVPAGYDLTTSNLPHNVTLSESEDYNDADFGYWQPAIIGGRVLEDVDDSGDFSGSDTPIPGITIRLYVDADGDGNPDSATPVATQTTNASGYYTFTNVVSGTYVIVETDLVTHTSVTDTQGSNDNRIAVTVNAGDTSTGNDFLDTRAIDLELDKAVNTTTPTVGEVVTFTLTVNNQGPSDASGVEVTDQLPSGYIFGGAIPSQGSYLAASGLWTIGNLTAGDSVSLTLTATVRATGVYTNVAQVTAADQHDTDSTPNNDDGDQSEDDEDNQPLSPRNPGLSLTKTRLTSDPVQVGDPIQFEIVVENVGNTNLITVPMIDTYDTTYLTYVSGSPASDNNDNNGVITWANVGPITVGNRVTVTVNFTAIASTQALPGDVTTNDGRASAIDENGSSVPPASDSDTVEISAPGLTVTKTLLSSSPVEIDNPVQFQLVVENTGDTALTTVPLTDTYDTAYLDFNNASLPVVDPTDDGQLNWNNVGPISVGNRVTITVNFTATQAVASTTNNVAATATDENGENLPEASDSDTVAIVVLPASIGDRVWIDTNGNGLQDGGEHGLAGVQVVLFSDGTPVATTTTIASGAYTFTNLTPGDYYVRFTAPSGYFFSPPDQDSNDAVDSDANPTTGQTAVTTLSSGETDSSWDAGLYRPGLEVDKSVALATVVPHQGVTYTITVTNTGNVILKPVAVTDTLPSGFTYQPGSGVPTAPAISGQELVWSDVTTSAGLLPNQSLQVSFVATMPTATNTYYNVAVVGGTHPGGVITDSDTAPVVVTDPQVDIVKNVVPPGAVNGIITFTIRITNTGPSTMEQVPLIDQFTGPIAYIGGTPPANTVDNTNQVIGWNDLTADFGQNLAPNESFLVTTVFAITSQTTEFTMTNVATVTNALDIYNNPANDDSDTEVLINIPTAVQLLYFRATRASTDVVLSWATAVEIDNFGFRIMRASGQLSDAVELAFVPGQGRDTAGGASYTYTDKNVSLDQAYTYWLVDVDINGTETWHGPVTIDRSEIDSGDGSKLYLPLIFK